MPTELRDATARIDQRLDVILSRERTRAAHPETTTAEPNEVSVFALVRDLAAFANRGDIAMGASQALDGGRYLVTARIPWRRVEAVAASPEVVSLHASSPLRPALWETVPDMGADTLPLSPVEGGGNGVLVGIIDYGCDFAHQNFRHPDGSTRIESIWDQSGTPRPGSPYGYGRLYTRADIDAALAHDDPYQALGYGPAPDSPYSAGTHGTHVMDIAAGNGLGSGARGLAPGADIAFVHVSSSDVPYRGSDVVGKFFGDSVNLAEAIAWLFEQAGDRPCVINVSLGTNGGPHDGTCLVARWIDSQVTARKNRAVVIAASNSQDDGIHASGTVPPQGYVDIRWRVPGQDFTHNEMEVWYPGSDRFRVEVLLPDGTSVGEVALGKGGRVKAEDGTILFYVSHQEEANGDNSVGIFMEADLPTGIWTVRLHADQVTDGSFHAWIERDDLGQSTIVSPRSDTHTIGSISCGHHSVVVGSYDARKEQKTLSWFSSAGPTRDGREKPELSAPGHRVHAAHSRTGTGVIHKSGTSMAAPAVAGVVALMMEAAHRAGIHLSADQLREILRATARRAPPAGTGWHARYGHGRMDAAAAVAAVQALAQAGPPGDPGEPEGGGGGSEPDEAEPDVDDAPPDAVTPAGSREPGSLELEILNDPDRSVQESLGHDAEGGYAEAFLELADPDDVPEGVYVRSRGQGGLVTALVDRNALESLEDDPRIISMELGKPMLRE